jgi:uncharacterized protein DUF1553/uncharacterized protein DUF1549
MRPICRILMSAVAFVATMLAAAALAQRETPADPAPANPEPPTIVGQVVAYEPDKSIAVETRNRKGVTKSEFAIVKDKTKIELPPRAREIKVGMTLAVWADKDDPKTAARIGTQASSANQPRTRRTNNRAAAEAATAVGQVAAFEADKSITVEVRQRGGQTRKSQFSIDKDRTKIELAGEAKEIAVGLPVSVWADKNDPKLAARIVAGAASAPMPRIRRSNPDQTKATPPEVPVTPKVTRPARPPVSGLDPLAVARQIDQQIDASLAADKIPPSPLGDDAEFLRRVYLDIAGVIPPADKAATFLGSTDPQKRAKLIDELLAGEDYGQHFADLWCDRINMKDLPIYREPFVGWLAECFNAGRGWDEIVYDLLTAEGSFNFITRGKRLGSVDPQALFVLLNTEEGQGKGPNPAWLAAESGRLFLGVQIQCAECHDHPFTESWKQTDFWGLAAFFGQLRSERDQQGLHWSESPAAANEPVRVAIPPTALKNVGQVVPARLLGADQEYQPASAELLRHSLARWMTGADNRLFAKATANRMWGHFFGRGLVNPVDDLRADNRPSHPEILETLARELRKSQFDLKHLIRCLCLSQAYQRTSVPLAENEPDREKYSHMAVKVMSPGVLYDSLKAATLWPELKVGLPERKTKLTVLSLYTPREVFVDFFRSSQGEEADPLENNHGIPQALKLMNAAQLSRIAPAVERLAESGMGRQQMIEQLYLTALSRRPSAAEAKRMDFFLSARSDANAEEGYNAVLWTLINSAEFVSNH